METMCYNTLKERLERFGWKCTRQNGPNVFTGVGVSWWDRPGLKQIEIHWRPGEDGMPGIIEDMYQGGKRCHA